MATFDLYQTVTDRIVQAIEETGSLPWIRPWGSVGIGAPRNGESGRKYHGVNAILLAIAGMNYGSNEWYTFNNAKKLGGSVRKGEKATLVVYWNILEREDGDTGLVKKIPMLRYFNVFNRAQIDGLPAPATVPALTDFERNERAEATINGTGADIRHGGDSAHYSPRLDYICLPERSSFVSESAYYSTAFHELAHWTGHESRINRLTNGIFGSPSYAKEELIAELASAFLCAEHSVDGQTQHPQYLANWLRALKEDKKYIFQVAGAAQKAADRITQNTPADDAGE
jgi:antirestriction protein ArdC